MSTPQGRHDIDGLVVRGNVAAQAAFAAALTDRSLHHAWLLTGPEGTGKATFALAAATRMLAAASGGPDLPPGLVTPDAHPAKALIVAGSHPDLRVLRRLPKDPDKPELARSITIAQVRSLQSMFATTPSLGPRRVVIIDAIDDLERGGANALLKNLEEPPAGTVFLLVSHAPGRLLPTIRSRCRILRFESLGDPDTAVVIRAALPESDEADIQSLVGVGEGSPGRALRYAGLDVAALDGVIAAIAEDGDPANGRRVKLAKALAGKPAQQRYEAFLERVPSFIVGAARGRHGSALAVALDAHAAARDLAGAALGLSLDPQATVIEMAGIVARLHAREPML